MSELPVFQPIESHDSSSSHDPGSREVADDRYERLITDDKEILGESTHLRRSLRGTTRDITNEVHGAHAALCQVASKPREGYLTVFRNRNELKIYKLEQKIASDPDAPHHKRDKEWLAMHKARRDHWQGKLGKQESKREARTTKLSEKTEARHERYQSYIDKYMHKKIEAIRKKEYRQMQKEQSIGRFNHGAQVEFFRRLPEVQKRRITQEAILAVRDKNIQKGNLRDDYLVEPGEIIRSIDNYERSVR